MILWVKYARSSYGRLLLECVINREFPGFREAIPASHTWLGEVLFEDRGPGGCDGFMDMCGHCLIMDTGLQYIVVRKDTECVGPYARMDAWPTKEK